MTKKIYITQRPTEYTHEYNLKYQGKIHTSFHAHCMGIGEPPIFLVLPRLPSPFPKDYDYAKTFLEADKKAYEHALQVAHLVADGEDIILVDRTSRGKASRLVKSVKESKIPEKAKRMTLPRSVQVERALDNPINHSCGVS